MIIHAIKFYHSHHARKRNEQLQNYSLRIFLSCSGRFIFWQVHLFLHLRKPYALYHLYIPIVPRKTAILRLNQTKSPCLHPEFQEILHSNVRKIPCIVSCKWKHRYIDLWSLYFSNSKLKCTAAVNDRTKSTLQILTFLTWIVKIS